MELTRRGTIGLNAVVALLYLFLLAPIVIVVIAAFNAGEYLQFPPDGFSLRWFQSLAASEPFIDAFLFSLRLAAVVTVLSTVIGTAAALYLTRYSRRFRGLLRLLIISPLPVPAILTGIALLIFFYATDISTNGFVNLALGHIVVTIPYVFLTVSTVLVGFDRSLEEAARSLGAGPWTTFRRVTLPILKSGIVSGAVFAFIISFDQFPKPRTARDASAQIIGGAPRAVPISSAIPDSTSGAAGLPGFTELSSLPVIAARVPSLERNAAATTSARTFDIVSPFSLYEVI